MKEPNEIKAEIKKLEVQCICLLTLLCILKLHCILLCPSCFIVLVGFVIPLASIRSSLPSFDGSEKLLEVLKQQYYLCFLMKRLFPFMRKAGLNMKEKLWGYCYCSVMK